MKNTYLIFSFLFYSFLSNGMVELCPEGLESGSDGCYEIDAVLIMGEWVNACCSNVEVPDGYNCVHVDCYAFFQNKNTTHPNLTKQNAYVLFAQGYRTWVIVDNNPKTHLFDTETADLNMETIRAYLPISRKVFSENADIDMLSINYSDNVRIIIQRPEKEEKLQDEIIFPQLVSSKELGDYLKVIDENMLKVYPNPTSEILTISFENSIWISVIEVTSIDGKKVMCIDYPDSISKANINVASLKPGSYILSIIDKSGRTFNRQVQKI